MPTVRRQWLVAATARTEVPMVAAATAQNFLSATRWWRQGAYGWAGGWIGSLGERRHAERERAQSSDEDLGFGMHGRSAILPGAILRGAILPEDVGTLAM